MQLADCRPGIKYRLRVKCRLQSGGKIETEGKTQTADCRPGIKYRLRVKRRLQTADQRIKY